MASLTGSGYAFILHVDLVCKGEEVFKILHPSPHQMLTDHCDSESIRVDLLRLPRVNGYAITVYYMYLEY